MLEAAAGDAAARPAFTAALLDSEIYVLGTFDGTIVEGVAQAGGSMRPLTVTDDDGELTPFFSSEAALQRFVASSPDTDPQHVQLSCRSLFSMARASRLVLNPSSPYGKAFVPEEIEALLTGQEPGLTTEVVDADRNVLVGAPAHLPPELPAVLSRFFAQRPVVEAAHLGWIAHPDGHSGYLLVVVASDAEQAMAGFGSVAIGDVTGGATLESMVVPPGSDSPFLATAPRFYT